MCLSCLSLTQSVFDLKNLENKPHMKNIIYLLILFFFAASFHLPGIQSQTIPEPGLKFLADKIKDPDFVIGVYNVPTGKDPMRKVSATNDYPESDTNYISLAIDMTLMKLNSVQQLKGETDSVVFVKMPFGGISEEVPITFYSFPGTEWLMVLQRGISTDKAEKRGWLKEIKNLDRYKWVNEQTAFIADPYNGNFSLKWNDNFERPQGVIRIDQMILSDVRLICKGMKDLSQTINRDDYNAKIAEIKAQVKTGDGKRLCEILER
jgi:hypothetical protein